jgi:excisionase family DNA binding protein
MEQLLTPREAAALLKVTQRTLRTWRADSEGPPYYKLNGKTIRYPADKLADWQRAQGER